MREVVLDTETTGLSPETGDRVVEIGCLELANHMATGRTYHCYINPQMTMPAAKKSISTSAAMPAPPDRRGSLTAGRSSESKSQTGGPDREG